MVSCRSGGRMWLLGTARFLWLPARWGANVVARYCQVPMASCRNGGRMWLLGTARFLWLPAGMGGECGWVAVMYTLNYNHVNASWQLNHVCNLVCGTRVLGTARPLWLPAGMGGKWGWVAVMHKLGYNHVRASWQLNLGFLQEGEGGKRVWVATMNTLVKVTAVRPCVHHSGAGNYQVPMASCKRWGANVVGGHA